MKLDLDLEPVAEPAVHAQPSAGGGDLRYAGFWIRFATFVIDSVCVLLFVSIPLGFAFGSGHWQLDPSAGLPALAEQLRTILQQIVTEYAVLLVVYGYFWVKYLGTPGKLVLGLQVVDARTLGPLTVKQSVVRYLGYFVSSMAGCLGFIWVGIDARKQGFHDIMAQSLVIYRRAHPEPAQHNAL